MKSLIGIANVLIRANDLPPTAARGMRRTTPEPGLAPLCPGRSAKQHLHVFFPKIPQPTPSNTSTILQHQWGEVSPPPAVAPGEYRRPGLCFACWSGVHRLWLRAICSQRENNNSRLWCRASGSPLERCRSFLTRLLLRFWDDRVTQLSPHGHTDHAICRNPAQGSSRISLC